MDHDPYADFTDNFYPRVFNVIPFNTSLKNAVGRGAQGTVFKVIKDDKAIVFKQVALNQQDQFTVDPLVWREIAVLKSLQSPYITQKSILWFRQYFYYEMEHAGNSLEVLLKRNNILEEDITKKIVYQILCGITHCHEHGVIHRDLKPANILVQPVTFTTKIGDFGLSRDVSIPVATPCSPKVQTLNYRAPELLLEENGYQTWTILGKTIDVGHTFLLYDYKVDIWSIGCILAEMYKGRIFFEGWDENEIVIIDKIIKMIGPPASGMFRHRVLETKKNGKNGKKPLLKDWLGED
ncbi:Cell division control protein 2 [Nowakowskiella sp. JEL0407]|nr:Cell division control protein 2 [Nowakowskiella sp. JEL0407]